MWSFALCHIFIINSLAVYCTINIHINFIQSSILLSFLNCVNKIVDGLPCCDGTGDYAHRRHVRPRACTDGFPAPQFLRNFAAPEGRRCQLSLNREGWLDVYYAPCKVQREKGEEAGSRRLRHTGRCALTASRKNNRPRQRRFHWYHKSPTNHARVAAAPICAPEKASCRPLAAPNSRIRGMGSYPSLQQGRIKEKLRI
jgi:hypothetical protein